MPAFPSLSTILLEIRQSLGLERPQSKKISSFLTMDMPLDKLSTDFACYLEEIFDVLEMDQEARRDIVKILNEHDCFIKEVEVNTWTRNANRQQILWYFLAYDIVPVLARRLAYWQTGNINSNRPVFDVGMPGGKFWFLPTVHKNSKELELPVPKVLDWLLDLLGVSTENGLDKQIKYSSEMQNTDHNFDSKIRNLYYWRTKTLIKSQKTIKNYFPDDLILDFQGTFESEDTHSSEDSFKQALDFVIEKKGLNQNNIQNEIPMNEESLAHIFNDSASQDEKQRFVEQIKIRYAKPEMRTIRQRFTIARMVQDAYFRLLKDLCPDIKKKCADPSANKLVQLIDLFCYIYNLSIQATKYGNTFEEQDEWFESQLPLILKSDLLLSITQPLSCHDIPSIVGNHLSEKFLQINADGSLEDVFNWKETLLQHTQRFENFLKNDSKKEEEQKKFDFLYSRLISNHSPWRTLQKEQSFNIIWAISQNEELSPKIRSMAIDRVDELASSSWEQLLARVLRLDYLLIQTRYNERPEDIQAQVEKCLNNIESNPAFPEWEPVFLRHKALHALQQNNFKEAEKHYKEAFNALHSRSFGLLQREIAKETLAVSIFLYGLDYKKQRKYFNYVIDNNMWSTVSLNISNTKTEDIAVDYEKYFWEALYCPYPNVKKFENFDSSAIIESLFRLIISDNTEYFQQWIKQHKRKYLSDDLHDVRRNSVMLLLLKITHPIPSNFLNTVIKTGGFPTQEIINTQKLIENIRLFIRLLLEMCPKQARITDFKKQTPLMDRANDGDVDLIKQLLPYSDINAQDYLGRTAMHFAIGAHHPDCLEILLEAEPNVSDLLTNKGNSILHACVQFCDVKCTQLVLENFPGLVLVKNNYNLSPSELVKWILDNWDYSQKQMNLHNRNTDNRSELQRIGQLIEEYNQKLS